MSAVLTWSEWTPNVRFLPLVQHYLQERIHAGIARARKNGTKTGKPIGRARTSRKVEDAIRASLASGNGIHKTARECGVGTGTGERFSRTTSEVRNFSVPSRRRRLGFSHVAPLG
jgi:hypothetical protein